MLLILLIAAGAILETLFIMQSYRRRNVASIILKTTASLLFRRAENVKELTYALRFTVP